MRSLKNRVDDRAVIRTKDLRLERHEGLVVTHMNGDEVVLRVFRIAVFDFSVRPTIVVGYDRCLFIEESGNIEESFEGKPTDVYHVDTILDRQAAVVSVAVGTNGVNLGGGLEGPEDDRGSGGSGWPVGGFLGGESSAGSFLGADVGPGWSHRDEVAAVGDLSGEVGLQVVQVSGGKRPRRH